MTRLFKLFCSLLGLVAPIGLLLLYVIVMMSFINRWDQVVAITLVPIWLWAAVGVVLSFIVWVATSSRLSLISIFVWLISGLVCADQTPGLLREFRSAVTGAGSPPPIAAYDEKLPVKEFRIVSFNTAKGNLDAALQLVSLRPDIVMLQESPAEPELDKLRASLFDRSGSVTYSEGTAIITRGTVTPFTEDADHRHVGVTVRFPKGPSLHLLNLHLGRAAPHLAIWKRHTWESMTYLRVQNRTHLRKMLRQFPEVAAEQPAIVAGDFGTPPGDDLFRSLTPEYRDAFREVGQGWGDTWPGQPAIVRIDQIWGNHLLEPIRSFTVRSPDSDHRIVVADYRIVQAASSEDDEP